MGTPDAARGLLRPGGIVTSDELLALAYWCLALDTIAPIRGLPVADRIAIYDRMAEIRAEQRRIAAGLVGGRAALGDLLTKIRHEAR